MSKDILNEKTDETVKRIHLLVTDLCSRNCPNCCNKCYSLNDIPVVTDEELSKAEWLFLTGGEPFEFTNPSAIALHYKSKYPNIKYVIVYGNAENFFKYLCYKGELDGIDGVSLSIKNEFDLEAWNNHLSGDPLFRKYSMNGYAFRDLKHNILYNFLKAPANEANNFKVVKRKWVDYKDWKPNPDSIFRRVF